MQNAERKWRVAFVSSHPVPYHVPMYRALATRPEVDLEVLYTHDHGVKETFDAEFGRTVKFDVPLLEGYRHRFLRNIAPRPGFAFTGQINPALSAAVARGEYDAVIVHGYATLSTLAALVGPRGRRTKLLLRSETTLLAPRSAPKRVAKQVLIRALFKRVDHFLAIGTLSRKYFEAYGVRSERITISPYTVDNTYFEEKSARAREDRSAARRRLGLPPEKPIFLFCSKMVQHKRPLDVLHAFARSRLSGLAVLAYVGEGKQMDELRAEVARLGVGNDVQLLGFRNQSELPEIYGACDVFVQASERESWGMVVNEAMACGMAICASDQVGSAYDLIQDNGAMFPVGDIDRLAALMADWARAPDRIQRMRESSLRRIHEWTVDHTVDGIVSGVRAALAR